MVTPLMALPLITGTVPSYDVPGALAPGPHPWVPPGRPVVPPPALRRALRGAGARPDSLQAVLERIAALVDRRDLDTGHHSRRVVGLCAAILRTLDAPAPRAADRRLILAAARLHDIGKIGIPDGVLNKAGMLAPAEQALMATHAARGAEILLRYPALAPAAPLVRHHHERWDGQGYPSRLHGSAIPLGARVIAVADSFDAMTSDRPYRQALPVAQALAILRAGRGQQWDPAIVDAFLRALA